MNDDSNTYDCIDIDSNTINPHFGSVTVSSSDGTTASVPGGTIKVYTEGLISGSEYNVVLRGITDSSFNQPLSIVEPLFGASFIELPELGIGTYNLEIQEINNGISNYISLTFLWHTKIKNLETAIGSVCVGTDADFWVNNTSLSTNYRGSYIKFDFGDETTHELYPLSQLLINNVDVNDNKYQISHQYDLVSCGDYGEDVVNEAGEIIGKSFITSINLYNKYLDGSTSALCSDYMQNGEPQSASIKTGDGPTASFTMPFNNCVGTDIVINNDTDQGSFGGSSGVCVENSQFYWSVKANDGPWTLLDPNVPGLEYVSEWLIGETPPPVDSTQPILFFLPEISGDYINLTIPAQYVTTPGCWQVKLEARNSDVCTTSDIYTYDFIVEDIIEPDFNILNSEGQVVSEICDNDIVYLDDLTEFEVCDESTASWTIQYAEAQ